MFPVAGIASHRAVTTGGLGVVSFAILDVFWVLVILIVSLLSSKDLAKVCAVLLVHFNHRLRSFVGEKFLDFV